MANTALSRLQMKSATARPRKYFLLEAPSSGDLGRLRLTLMARSLVGFGPKSRYLGEPAKSQEISNLKNTVGCLKRIAGRHIDDPEIKIEQQYITAPLVDVNGEVGVQVKYLGQDEKFSATQLIAMLLTKIKQTAAAELKLPVSDVVISVPNWFTDRQRRSMIDAAEIAGLKLLRLINDTTAAALGYGITKTDLPPPEEKPRRVAFVDMGYSNYTVSIVNFQKGELKVVATADDRHVGGRAFDKVLIDHFAAEFKEKYKIDILNNPKAYARLAVGAEKVKKVLSANAQAPLNIESIMPDIDVTSMIKRDEFEQMAASLLDRVNVVLAKALEDAKLGVEDIDYIELVGGSVRIPAVKDRIAQFFNKPLSFTLNQDEAIARGCAFACAILSPAFRVREFSVHDIVPYPIEFTWEQSQDIPDEDTNLTVFNKGNSVPSTKILTFYRKEPFDLEAKYAEPQNLPGAIPSWIGRFSVKNVHPDDKGDFMICKLKTRVNLFGVLNVESGHYVEEIEVEEEIKEEGDVSNISGSFHNSSVSASAPSNSTENSQPSDPRPSSPVDGARRRCPSPEDIAPTKRRRGLSSVLINEPIQAMETDESRPKKTRKVKKTVKKGDLEITGGTSALDAQMKRIYSEREAEMDSQDKLVSDTAEKKNALESYIYEIRAKLDGVLAEFASADEKARLQDLLAKTEV